MHRRRARWRTPRSTVIPPPRRAAGGACRGCERQARPPAETAQSGGERPCSRARPYLAEVGKTCEEAGARTSLPTAHPDGRHEAITSLNAASTARGGERLADGESDRPPPPSRFFFPRIPGGRVRQDTPCNGSSPCVEGSRRAGGPPDRRPACA